MRRSVEIALTSVLGSLAILITIVGFYRFFPFPLAPYLKFDPAEIIDVLAYMLGGWRIGFLTATIHFLGLLIYSGDPLGPTMKYLAVISMITGLHIAYSKRLGKGYAYLLAAVSRIGVMTVANLYVLLLIAPGFLQAFEGLASSMGLHGLYGQLAAALIVTGIYNLIHIPFTLVPTEFIYRGIKISIPLKSPVSREQRLDGGS